LEFCKNDQCPPPPRLLNIVMCPSKSTVSELIVELNENSLSEAQSENLSATGTFGTDAN
jgi:hypothetical protein